MDSAKSWFHKLQPKEKSVMKKKDLPPHGKEGCDEAPSSATKQRVAAAKQYIENHYKEQMKSLQERKERRDSLERKLADADMSEEEQNNILKYLERKETEYMRLQRHKMGVDDFELLTMIGKGAFGEVRVCSEKTTGNVYAMKKLKKSEMLRRGQVEHVKAERNLNYIHRDIKPDNLLLDRYGHLKLSDFGLCKPLDCSNFPNLHEKDISQGKNYSGSLQSDGRPSLPKRTQQEQLEHWQKNRRTLVINDCSEAEAWLREKNEQQNALPKHTTPILRSADVKRKAEILDRSEKRRRRPLENI